jgi:hypothetical protein
MSSSSQRNVIVIGALLAAAAVILQFVLMFQNRVTSVPEMLVRFFSFFTILTNTLVAICFIAQAWFPGTKAGRFFARSNVFSAILVYIFIVGAVYQVVLRHIWEPTGLQMLVDEALHTVIPVYVLFVWFAKAPAVRIRWGKILQWLIYPVVYFAYVLLRGSVSGFYPYPFIDVGALGIAEVLRNAVVILGCFALISIIVVGVANLRAKS